MRIFGHAIAGRGRAANHIDTHRRELEKATGLVLLAGSFNVLLDCPLLLDEKLAVRFDDDRRYLWPGTINDIDVWLYRWRGAPLHVIEILSSVHIGKSLGLAEGDSLTVTISDDLAKKISGFRGLVWALFWAGRRDWYYKRHLLYGYNAKLWCSLLHANQSGNGISMLTDVKKFVGVVPGVKRMLNFFGAKKGIFAKYKFERLSLKEGDEVDRQIRNLLNYAKTSGSSYSAQQFPAGYHTLSVNGKVLKGQRDPSKRLANLAGSMDGVTILDLGTNQGGMLFELAERVKWAVGVDYDYRMINAANRIKSVRGCDNLDFYVVNLEKDPLNLIRDMMPDQTVDVVFLLSVCMWLRNWQDVIRFGSQISDNLLFESNGSPAQQVLQENELIKLYRNVERLADESSDDDLQKDRRLFYCSGSVNFQKAL